MPLMAEKKRKIVPPAMLQKPVWTLGRQMMGNLIPLSLALPLLSIGLIMMYVSGRIFSPGLGLVALSIIVGWLMTNFFGLHENYIMKQQMTWRLEAAMKEPPSRRYFVGVATPNFKGMLDPHEDVGYLLLYGDRIEYHGEKMRLSLRRSEIVGFERRPNIHSLIALGGWLVICAERDGRPIELKVEVRERPTLRANRRLTRLLFSRLRQWREDVNNR
jgi:hypothetical protein